MSRPSPLPAPVITAERFLSPSRVEVLMFLFPFHVVCSPSHRCFFRVRVIPLIAGSPVEKGVEGANAPVLEDRNIHSHDNGSGSIWSKLPPYAAVIVIHLRRAC